MDVHQKSISIAIADEGPDGEVRLYGTTKNIAEAVSKVIRKLVSIRNTFSLSKLSYVESTGAVIYCSKMSHGGNKKNFQTFSALEFIAAITSHIPYRLMQITRYYGWYSNRMRGDRLKAEAEVGESEEQGSEESDVIIVSGFKPKKIP